MNRLRAVDAFCGAGGLSLGVMRAGFNVMLGFDIDPLCIKTLQANSGCVGEHYVESDISSMLNGGLLSLIGLEPGELDLLAGGPPCQGFSVQRTVGDDTDERNLLVHDFGDLIAETYPRFFILENVVGLGGKRGREVLASFEQRVNTFGYVIHKRTLDAQDYGVPQRRRRVIVVGERSEPASTQFHWPDPLPGTPPTVRETIGSLPPPPEDGTEHPLLPGHRADRLSATNRQRLISLKPGQGRTDLPESLLADCHRVSADVVGHRNVYGRMDWDQVAPTITARFDSFTRGKFGHPEQIRSISLYEGQLLQTFPATYRFIGNKVEVARQIGNAVPPVLGAAIARSVAKAILER